MPKIKKQALTGGDFLDARGARTLAHRVATYWHAKRYPSVSATAYEMANMPGVWGVRSNLVGGLPRGMRALR